MNLTSWHYFLPTNLTANVYSIDSLFPPATVLPSLKCFSPHDLSSTTGYGKQRQLILPHHVSYSLQIMSTSPYSSILWGSCYLAHEYFPPQMPLRFMNIFLLKCLLTIHSYESFIYSIKFIECLLCARCREEKMSGKTGRQIVSEWLYFIIMLL